MSPAGSTIDRYVLVPGWHAQVKAMHVTPIELFGQVIALQQHRRSMVEILFILSMNRPFHSFLPVSTTTRFNCDCQEESHCYCSHVSRSTKPTMILENLTKKLVESAKYDDHNVSAKRGSRDHRLEGSAFFGCGTFPP